MIESSIQRNGFGRSILLANDGTVIAGNATIDAAASAGLDDVLVIETDGTKVIAVKRTDVEPGSKEFHNLAIADNRAAELAEWDADVLAELSGELDLSPFFGDDELAKLLSSVTTEGLTDPDDVPTVTEPTTKPGDLWLLGRHRLLCGDSTVATDVERLMGGERADICFTSPPYNVGRTPNGDKQKYLADADNRSTAAYRQLLYDVTVLALTASQYVFVNVQGVAGNKTALIDYLHELKDQFAETIIWDKLTAEPAMASNVLNSRFEFVYVFSDAATRVIGTQPFRGTLANVVPINSRQDKQNSDTHKATFPVEFAAHFVGNFSTTSVYDPFLGSGTTLIAAEQLNRTCYGMEIDPHYCDVIVKRWEQFTGQTATLDAHALAAD